MSGELVWAMVRMLVALPLVLGLVYLVLKYGLARRYITTTGQRRMKLVEQLPLGAKSTLSLVSVGGVYYLLAHQDNSISLVKELGELPEMDEINIADVVEVKPRSIKEYDRLRTAACKEGVRKKPAAAGESFAVMLKKLAGQLAPAQRAVMTRITNRTVFNDKGGKRIEG